MSAKGRSVRGRLEIASRAEGVGAGAGYDDGARLRVRFGRVEAGHKSLRDGFVQRVATFRAIDGERKDWALACDQYGFGHARVSPWSRRACGGAGRAPK